MLIVKPHILFILQPSLFSFKLLSFFSFDHLPLLILKFVPFFNSDSHSIFFQNLLRFLRSAPNYMRSCFSRALFFVLREALILLRFRPSFGEERASLTNFIWELPCSSPVWLMCIHFFLFCFRNKGCSKRSDKSEKGWEWKKVTCKWPVLHIFGLLTIWILPKTTINVIGNWKPIL